MKGDVYRGPAQRHVYLAAFGWTADGYEPRHSLAYDVASERVGRGRHREPHVTAETRLQFQDLLAPFVTAAR